MRAPLRHVAVCSVLAVIALATWLLPSSARAQDLLSGPSDAAEDQPQQQQLTAEDVQRMFKEAEEALETEDYQKALSTYDTLIKILKQQGMQAQVFLPVVYTGRGRAFQGLDDVQAAKTDFDEAIKENPQHIPALLARGKLYFDVGANDLAYADFQAAQEQDRQNPEVLFGLGKALVLLGGADQAVKPLTHAITADENNAEAYQLRAQAYAATGDFEKANEDIQHALNLDPDNYENYFALATIKLREEEYKPAIDAIEDAIQRFKPKKADSDEPFGQGYLTKAAILLEFAKEDPDPATKAEAYEQALAETDKLIELVKEKPQYASYLAAAEFRRGVCLRLMGRFGDAIASLTEAINLNPNLAEAYFRRGICFYYMGENDLAILDFKHAANIEYQDPRPKMWEGFAQSQNGEYLEAVRCYGLALADSDRYVPAYVNRGLAYMMLGDNEKALKDFNQALRLEPAEWTHYFKRGMVLERMDKPQQAADSFVAAIRHFDQYPPAYRHAADALDQLGHRDLASEYRKRADEIEAEQKKAQEAAAAQQPAQP